MPMVRRCKAEGCHALAERPAHYCTTHHSMEAAYIEKRERYSRTRYNKRVRNRDDESKERYAFYRSKVWSSIRKIALERDNYLCQYCLALGMTTPDARIGDHVTPVEIAPELRTEISNVVATCRSCDNTKRTLEQEIYGTGQNRTKQNTELRLSVASWADLIARKKEDVVKPL